VDEELAAGDDAGRMVLRAVPVDQVAPARAIGLADGDGGDAEQRAFHRGGDRARIGHVLGDVLAAVDAGDDKVGFLPDHHLEAHDDAVGRRAAHRIAPLARLPQPDRIGDRQRVSDAGLVGLRRDDPHLVGEFSRDPLQDREAFGVDAVIVGQENAHRFRAVRSFRARPCTA